MSTGVAAGDSPDLHPDLIPGPVFRLLPDGTVAFMNAAARTLLSSERVMGHSWLDLWPQVPPRDWTRLVEEGGSLRHDGQIAQLAFSFILVQESETGAVFAYGADVTELKRAQEVLAEQTAELRENALFPEMNPGPVFRLDLDDRVLRANRAARSLFGEDVIGRSWREVVPAAAPEEWDRIVNGGIRSWAEARVGDTEIGLTIARAPESPFVYVYGSDITALKAAEREIQEMALFPEMNPGPVLRLDANGRILLANGAARDLLPARDLPGKSWMDLCPGMTRALLDRVLDRSETASHEARIGNRHILFTHTPGATGEQVFVYGADLTDLKDAEQALRQSERMATLGTLAAGVAHELNNPAAAAQRAAEHLRSSFGSLQEAQLRLNRLALGEEILTILAKLDAEARDRAMSPPDFDPVSRSDREYDVELWLEDHEFSDGWEMAPALVSLGYGPGELDRLSEAVPPDYLGAVVEWMTRTYPVYSVLEEIRHGAGRISEIVGALKAYSYVDRAPVQAVDVNEGLRHTLIILQNKLKRGVTVELDLDPELPRIEAYGGELNQVWTNLIDNAVDAVRGEGKLRLRSVGEDEWIRIEVEDDGPGIPTEIQGRIFDPFFTTKEPGRGTGLGLNTTFNIVVKKHGGRIELQSRPGRTCFIVRLPHELDRASASRGPDEGEAVAP